MLVEAKGLENIDNLYNIHLQAWANVRAEATKNKGTEKKPKIVPLYEEFNDFFDYEGAIDTFWNGTKEKQEDKNKELHDKELMNLLNKANTKGGN